MIIFGWGKVTRKVIGEIFSRTCQYCNTTNSWQLCIIRTWFTLFFIPVIPYAKTYCISCPNCGSYVKLTEEEFEKIRREISEKGSSKDAVEISDSIKYQGKTETQINFLKQMEEYHKKQAEAEK